MTYEQLLKNIAKIVDHQLAAQLIPLQQNQQEILNQLEDSDSRLQFLEITYRALLRQVESLEKTYKLLDRGQKDLYVDIKYLESEQLAQSRTLKYLKTELNRTGKTVKIIANRYDQRLVQNTNDIAQIKTHFHIS